MRRLLNIITTFFAKVWHWLTHAPCAECRTITPMKELTKYNPFRDEKHCRVCYRKLELEDLREHERVLLSQAIEKEKRRLRARKIAEREVARETYRDDDVA